MTKDKRSISGFQWTVSILAALMFGAFLGSPASENWTGQFLHTISFDKPAYEVITKTSVTAASPSAVNTTATGSAVNTAASGAAIELPVSQSAIDVVVSESPAETQPEYVSLNANRGGVADRKEKDVLIRLINAEAYGLSYKAKLAVGQVVMNRWTGPYYGDDLMAIMTAPHQFTPICDGSAYEKEIEPDSVKAANAVLDGAGVTELTEDTYYFVNPDFTEDKTIENKMEFVCEIEGIHFYRPPSK